MAGMTDLLNNLNPKQKEAVLATEGPVLILAGPGSGKTKTLTSRVAYLLHMGVAPENILAVTFTNRAAEEMRARIGALTSNQLPVTSFIGTFHALAVRILRVHAGKIGHNKNFTIFDDADSLALVKEVMKELDINPKQFPAGAVAGTISKLKNELYTPERYEEEGNTGDFFPKNVHRVWQIYQKRLLDANAMDFDDLLLNVCLLLKQHPAVLESYQHRFRYINVDEYQDVNTAQYVLMRELARKHRNIAVVGDDAQAIYAFRGADYRNILNFEKDWPEAKVVVLDQNYRSTQLILDAAREVIAKNQAQKEKKLWTERQGGEPIVLVPAQTEREEAEFVAEKIQDLAREGFSLKDMVVLYRTNAQSRVMEEMLLTRNLPYLIIGGVRFYQRKEVKDILAYIRYALNPKDLLSLKRIINVPARGIGPQTLLKYLQNGAVDLPERARTELRKFERALEELRQKISAETPTASIKHLLKTVNYKEYLEDEEKNAEERWENVQELINLARKYDDPPAQAGLPPSGGMEKLLEDVALMSDQDQPEAARQTGGVRLMTLHAAKGLEFPVVFMIGLEEGIFPHSRSQFNPRELEEERRLMFVGLTRAKEKIFLLFALRRAHFGAIQANPPSRFISEIPEHLLEVQEEGIGEISYG